MLIIGLTGGIGCGKSTVANLFSKLQIPVKDADLIAHKLVKPRQPALKKITHKFGAEIITSNGLLDREKLRHQIFNSPHKKKELEKILHPLIFQEMKDWALLQTVPYVIFSIPLLFETNYQKSVNRTLIVDLPVKQQILRVMQRDNKTEVDVQKIIDNQVSREQRKQLTDDQICNEGSTQLLEEQVFRLNKFYLSISR